MGELVSAQEAKPGSSEFAALQIAACACDDSGHPLYSIEQARQLVTELDWILVQRIIGRAQKLNSLSDVAVETARGN